MTPFSDLCSTMSLNTCFKELLSSSMLHCSWNSIQIHHVASFLEIEDLTLKGCIVNVSVGRDTAGSFSVRGALHSADGDIVISSSRETVKCYAGRKPWTLLRFTLERKEESIDGFDKQYLTMLGFSLSLSRTSQLWPMLSTNQPMISRSRPMNKRHSFIAVAKEEISCLDPLRGRT